jgi:hypothetical protein
LCDASDGCDSHSKIVSPALFVASLSRPCLGTLDLTNLETRFALQTETDLIAVEIA